MIVREATIDDIPQMSQVRMSVKENILNNPDLVKHQDYIDYLTLYGKGWVAEVDGTIVGFAVAGLQQNNIWALFVHPSYEKKGIGRKLHEIMMQWYFENTKEPVWLSTAPGTRAEAFYNKAGWKATGMLGNEIRFEMEYNK